MRCINCILKKKKADFVCSRISFFILSFLLEEEGKAHLDDKKDSLVQKIIKSQEVYQSILVDNREKDYNYYGV